MTNDNGGFLADNVTLVAKDGLGVQIMIDKARKLADDTEGFHIGFLSPYGDDEAPVFVLGHDSTDLVVTVEPNPRLIRIER